MSIFRSLELKEVVGDEKLTIFKYLSPITTMTDFAVASGTYSFTNRDELESGMYWLKDANEDLCRALAVGIDGEIEEMPKIDKCRVGMRVAVKYSDIKDFITSETKVTDDLSIIEFGNYPKNIFVGMSSYEFRKLYDKNRIHTTDDICVLPRKKDGMFSKFDIEETPVYEYKGIQFIEYEMQHAICTLDSKLYFKGEPILFKVEPIRWWLDKKNDVAVTQDIIIGGIPYSSNMGKSSYNDDEDVREYLEYFEKSICKTKNVKTKKKK